MPRKPTRDGRRVHINIRVSEPEAVLLDSVRGELRRGPWMREAALGAAHRMRNSGIPESLGIGIIVDDRQPPGIVSVIAPGEEKTDVRSFALTPEEAVPKHGRKPKAKRPCEHRIRPGSYCTRCGRLI